MDISDDLKSIFITDDRWYVVWIDLSDLSVKWAKNYFGTSVGNCGVTNIKGTGYLIITGKTIANGIILKVDNITGNSIREAWGLPDTNFEYSHVLGNKVISTYQNGIYNGYFVY